MSRPGLDGLTKGLWAYLARIPGDVMALLGAIFKVYGHLAFAPFISSLSTAFVGPMLNNMLAISPSYSSVHLRVLLQVMLYMELIKK